MHTNSYLSYFANFLVLFASKQVNGQSDVGAVLMERTYWISETYSNPALSSQWKDELTSYGNWSDLDYTSGCDARQTDWPATNHLKRIVIMASSWNKNPSEEPGLLAAITNALDFWFDRDFEHDDCINGGGYNNLNCPCGTPGFWSCNWRDQMIVVPDLVGKACLLLLPVLTPSQLSSCTTQTTRAYVRIDGDPNGALDPLTGDDLSDVAAIGITLSLITSNDNLLTEAFRRIFDEYTVRNKW